MCKTSLESVLAGNPYPGRGIMMGQSPDGACSVIVYFIMGRSENSRNRIFEETPDGIRTHAFIEDKMSDPSLIIYHPVRTVPGGTIVTNGDQTDTIRDFLARGESFEAALRTRAFEPDAPNYTPRISGLLAHDGSFRLSILKSADGDPGGSHRQFFDYDAPRGGEGRFIHTYMGDGDPLPSFRGEPSRVSITAGSASELAQSVWHGLNADNRVSLFVRFIDRADGTAHTAIRNKHA